MTPQLKALTVKANKPDINPKVSYYEKNYKILSVRYPITDLLMQIDPYDSLLL